jgi:hypothetical protein
VKATSTRGLVEDAALGWSQRLRVEVGGAGTLAQAGVVLPRLLADRLGLTTSPAQVVARLGYPGAASGPAAGGCGVRVGGRSDVPVGRGGDDRAGGALLSLGWGVGFDGVAGARRAGRANRRRRAARAGAGRGHRGGAGVDVGRHGQLPAVVVAGKELTRPTLEPGGRPRPVPVIRLDATLIEAASAKARAAGTYNR